jgi:uncharacterized repeat protein (TIGR04138 family)
MSKVPFAQGLLARIRSQSGPQYNERAYLFMLQSIEFLQARLEARRHVTGGELSWACRDYAHERFGLLARTVLEGWGVKSTADLGRIVYSLIDIGLLSSQPGDREEDFNDVYDFTVALDESYQMRWVPEQG